MIAPVQLGAVTGSGQAIPQSTPGAPLPQNYPAPVLSALQREFQRSSSAFDQSQLLPSIAVQRELGVPTNLVVEINVAAEAPPLPDIHITRASTFSSLAREFDSRSVIAVTGYPESGKTIAVAEFAGSYQGTVFWFSVPKSDNHPEAWYLLFCFALAKFLNCGSISPADLRSNLVVRKEPLLVVIDDAQNCHSLDVLGFLFQAAETGSPLWVLVVGIDAPEFIAAVRGMGLPEWRLPGLDEQEALSLFQLLNGNVNEEQKIAIEALRGKTDGHLGMLRLSHSSIRGIQTAADKDRFVSDLEIGLGGGIEAIQASMTERLRASLAPDALELCRRLSVAIRPFYRIVGEAVWKLDRPNEDFHKTWNMCSMGVFEHRQRNRYAIPDIYRDAFRREVSGTAIKAIHLAIANAITEPNVSRDIFDVEAHVRHLLLAGESAEALTAAAMYLALAEGPAEAVVKAFFAHRFAVLLADVANDGAIPLDTRIRWFAISSRIYGELRQRIKESEAVTRLYGLLHQDLSAIEEHTLRLAWAVVLMYSSQHDNPRWAQEAASHIDDADVPAINGKQLPFKAYLVLTAFLTSEQNPLAYIRTLLDQKGDGAGTRFWNEMFSYEFWRSTALSVYHVIEKDRNTSQDAVSNACAEIESLIQLANSKGEHEMQVFLEALLVNVLIDLSRAFEDACRIARQMADGFEHPDPRLVAYVHDTYGDALRCNGSSQDADSEYEAALELWPADEKYDRAESYLMKSICQARLSRYREAARYSHLAAESYLGCEPPPYMSVARGFLEAAANSVHGAQYSAAVRFLIRAHHILNQHRDRAEWPALGQVAWSVACRIKPDGFNPQPPEPGFTLGLKEVMEEAEKMVPAGPTLMLARACNDIDSPFRAISLFEDVLSECDTDELKTQVGSLALEAAIKVGSLPLAARYAALASKWPEQVPAEGQHGLHGFIVDYQLGRTLRLASIAKNETVAVSQIREALAAINETGVRNHLIDLLTGTLQAYSDALTKNSDSFLEEAFRRSIAANAIWIAREIAWFWCYRFTTERPTYENQFVRWHWRLNWLTLQMSPHDDPYLLGSLKQELDMFGRLRMETISESLVRVFDSVRAPHETPTEGLRTLIGGLANIACKADNVPDTATELSYSLRLSANDDCLEQAIDSFCTRVLDLVLHPGAPEGIARVRDDIGVVLRELARKTVEPQSGLRRRFEALDALAITLETGTPTEASFKELVRLRDRVSQLSANSAAQFYIWLRNFGEFGREDVFSFDDTCKLLLTPHVDALLAGNQLLSYQRIRLATCQLCAKSVMAQRNLTRAMLIVETQKRLLSPIASSAVEAADAAIESAIQELADIVGQLDTIEAEAVKLGLKQEVWSCCMERGGTRKVTGTILLRGLNETNAKEKWLLPSLEDFRRSIEMAGAVTSAMSADLVLKPAGSALIVARAIEDEAAISEFLAIIDEVRSTGLYDEQVAEQERFESHDPLLNQMEGHRGPFLKPDDEAIQSHVDLIMASTGFPPDRRQFVEDDIRKIVRIEEIQDTYCQHLQPLQNLKHLDSPYTAYTSKSKYVAACSLLGYEMSIEVDDIETTINAMKSVHCNDCGHRRPRRDEAKDDD